MPHSRRDLAKGLLAASLAAGVEAATPTPELISPGIWKIRIGTPEPLTPVSLRRTPPASATLPSVASCPATVTGNVTKRGCLVSLPLAPGELVYGLGLQLRSFVQRGLKKTLRVNSDPGADTGDSHAPAPFYVTTKGYGVLVDTACYASFYCGNKKRKGESEAQPSATAALRQSQIPCDVLGLEPGWQSHA